MEARVLKQGFPHNPHLRVHQARLDLRLLVVVKERLDLRILVLPPLVDQSMRWLDLAPIKLVSARSDLVDPKRWRTLESSPLS